MPLPMMRVTPLTVRYTSPVMPAVVGLSPLPCTPSVRMTDWCTPSVMPATPVVASVANRASARTSDARRWVRDGGRDVARMVGRSHLR